MMSLPNPRRLLTLNALFSRRRPIQVAGEWVQDTSLPADSELPKMHTLAGSQMARIAAEIALEEGSRRQYAPRRESEVLGARRR